MKWLEPDEKTLSWRFRLTQLFGPTSLHMGDNGSSAYARLAFVLQGTRATKTIYVCSAPPSRAPIPRIASRLQCPKHSYTTYATADKLDVLLDYLEENR